MYIVFRIGIHSVLISWRINCDINGDINGDIETVDLDVQIDFDQMLSDDVDPETGMTYVCFKSFFCICWK